MAKRRIALGVVAVVRFLVVVAAAAMAIFLLVLSLMTYIFCEPK